MRLPSQRQGALALVCAFLLAQLAGFVHLALERHAVCAEHGELLHVADSASSSAAAGHQERTGPSLADGSSGDAHAHCDVLPAVQPKQSVATGAPARSIEPLASAWNRAAPLAVAHAAVPLLLLAPKQSPPA